MTKREGFWIGFVIGVIFVLYVFPTPYELWLLGMKVRTYLGW